LGNKTKATAGSEYMGESAPQGEVAGSSPARKRLLASSSVKIALATTSSPPKHDRLPGWSTCFRSRGLWVRVPPARIALQFGSEKVVLRAEFTFRPVGILPDYLLVALSGQELDSVVEILPAKRIVVDLFEPSSVPKHAIAAIKLKEENPKITLQQIGDKLDISKRNAHLALQMGLAMRDAGIEDPFVRLNERPAKVARWK
jgi:hypothetical protein